MKLLTLFALSLLAMVGALGSWLSVMLGLYAHAMLAGGCALACAYGVKKIQTFLL